MKKIPNQLTLFDLPEKKKEKSMDEYFFLISPSDKIKREVKRLKEKLNDQVGIGDQNLWSKAHISLFKTGSTDGELVKLSAEKFLKGVSGFQITLDGHEIFKHGLTRSLVIKIKEKQQIIDIAMLFPRMKEASINPHLTIARVISSAALNTIADSLSDYDLRDEFFCDSVTILRKRAGESSYTEFHQVLLK